MLGNCEGAGGALAPHAQGAIADARRLVGGRRARAQRPGKRYAHTPPDYERHDTNFPQTYRRAREDSVVVRPARKVKRSSRAALFRPVPLRSAPRLRWTVVQHNPFSDHPHHRLACNCLCDTESLPNVRTRCGGTRFTFMWRRRGRCHTGELGTARWQRKRHRAGEQSHTQNLEGRARLIEAGSRAASRAALRSSQARRSS